MLSPSLLIAISTIWLAQEPTGLSTRDRLFAMAEARFGELSEGEAIVLESGLAPAVYGFAVTPDRSRPWEDSELVRKAARSELLVWMLREARSALPIASAGVRIVGVEFQGQLDLGRATTSGDLLFGNCSFDDTISVYSGRIDSLAFAHCELPGIYGPSAILDGELLVVGNSTVQRGIDLRGAEIGGDLVLQDSKFGSDQPLQVALDQIRVFKDIHLTDCEINGVVQLRGSTVEGFLWVDGLLIDNPLGECFQADYATIGGSVRIGAGSRVVGGVSFDHARIGGYFTAQDAHFDAANGVAIRLSGAKIGQAATFNRFHCRGSIGLEESEVVGRMVMRKGGVVVSDGVAINGISSSLGGISWDNDVRIQGQLLFENATLASHMALRDVELKADEGLAHVFGEMDIHGSVLIRDGVSADRPVELRVEHRGWCLRSVELESV